MSHKFILLLLIFFTSLTVEAQGKFRIVDNGKESVSTSFLLVNNIVVISAEVNGRKLSFLLDTGVRKTMLFNLKI